jgi:hypothetical protein
MAVWRRKPARVGMLLLERRSRHRRRGHRPASRDHPAPGHHGAIGSQVSTGIPGGIMSVFRHAELLLLGLTGLGSSIPDHPSPARRIADPARAPRPMRMKLPAEQKRSRRYGRRLPSQTIADGDLRARTG